MVLSPEIGLVTECFEYISLSQKNSQLCQVYLQCYFSTSYAGLSGLLQGTYKNSCDKVFLNEVCHIAQSCVTVRRLLNSAN